VSLEIDTSEIFPNIFAFQRDHPGRLVPSAADGDSLAA
jgi:hypothetical protein